KIFLCVCHFVQDGARFLILLRLGKHEGRKFPARERARAIKEGAVEIFIQRNQTAIEGGKREVMAVPKLFPIEMEGCGRLLSRFVIPAVGQDHAANVPKESGDFGQLSSLRCFIDAASVNEERNSLKNPQSGFGAEIAPCG